MAGVPSVVRKNRDDEMWCFNDGCYKTQKPFATKSKPYFFFN